MTNKLIAKTQPIVCILLGMHSALGFVSKALNASQTKAIKKLQARKADFR